MQLFIDRISKNGFNVAKILVVGNSERSDIVLDLLKRQLSWGHQVIGRLDIGEEKNSEKCLGRIEDLPRVLKNFAIDEVIFAVDGNKSIDMLKHLHICRERGVSARILPSLWEPGDRKLSVESCQETPFLTVRVNNINASGVLYKRVLDLIGSLVGSIIFLLIYPIIGCAIKLESPGPVLFKQVRVGRNGRTFTLYKFRSMSQDAEERKAQLIGMNEMQGALFKIEKDPRITRVGRWLRRTSIDEFPQFLNVLKGEMSLVGTRPPTPEEIEAYLPAHLRRISAKPGITGLWQISGRNIITDFEKVVELDCEYLERWRFLDDLKIILKTILVVLNRKGAI